MRKLAALSALLAALACLSAALIWRRGRVESRRPLAGLAEGDIRRILIDRAGEAIALEREGERWKLASPVNDLADQAASSSLASGLAGLAVGAEAASEVESYPNYGLQESSATRVRVYAKDAAPVLDGYFGAPALGYDSLYFRYAKERPVYLTTGLGAYHLSRGTQGLREPLLIQAPKEALASVSLERGGKAFSLKKSSAGWEADEALSALLRLRFAEFLEPSATDRPAFDRPELAAVLDTGARTERIVIGGPRKESSGPPLYRWAKAEARGASGLVPISEVDLILAALKNAGR